MPIFSINHRKERQESNKLKVQNRKIAFRKVCKGFLGKIKATM